MASVDEMLEHTAPGDLDWIFVNPAAVYGAHVPGERRGDYHRAPSSSGSGTQLLRADPRQFEHRGPETVAQIIADPYTERSIGDPDVDHCRPPEIRAVAHAGHRFRIRAEKRSPFVEIRRGGGENVDRHDAPLSPETALAGLAGLGLRLPILNAQAEYRAELRPGEEIARVRNRRARHHDRAIIP